MYGLGKALVFIIPLVALIMVWSLLSETPALSLALPLHLLFGATLVLGAFFFVFPQNSWPLVPDNWEWPMPRTARIIELPDGRILARHPAERVQMYDASGKYLRGWYLRIGDKGGFKMAFREPDSIVVVTHSLEGAMLFGGYDWITRHLVYTLDGGLVSETRVTERMYDEFPNQGNVERRFDTPWYLLPFASPAYAWVLAGFGFAGTAALVMMRKKRYAWLYGGKLPPESDDADQPPEGPAPAGEGISSRKPRR